MLPPTIKVTFVGGTYNGRTIPIPDPPAPQIRVAVLIHPKPTWVYVESLDSENFDYSTIKETARITYEVYTRDYSNPKIFYYSHMETVP